ncbi:N-acetylglucosamine 6-phosphate deacetylase [Jatrophihabitans sp. GAS493]|uniref:N-acetylglucosamine-6-phosphate deacetylase n=1 Tax=Jatrophihabitans sp. GAS493 TaxID=1907575 RepID=UPI000BB7FF2F|nr:N-acetylglucosamine-6-phosphate deacetylase [Jatrophihabitans sp. GAS493]SOD71710.1 N-acetylglucosamine 6-phosphate deacetylase [Jatrophihabitans sp. GAS493]
MSILTGARVVTPGGVIDDGRIEIVDDRIVSVAAAENSPAAADHLRDEMDLTGSWLLPGFIDLHMHGGGGYDVTRSASDMAAAVAFHRGHGTTRTLVSLMAQQIDAMCDQLAWVSDLAAAGVVAGAHLEGPFLSAARCGAQRPENLLAPDPLVLHKLLEAGQGVVRTVTIAPELPGALELIRDMVAAGVVAAVGHTDASYEQTAAAFAAGASLATHLFNAMGSFNQRAPGPAIAALDAGVFVEMINDGVHVHESLTRLVERTAPDRLAFITDAISATGVGDGEYSLGDQAVRVRDGQARLSNGHSLAGSTHTMDEAVRRAVLEVGMSIEAASLAASGTPARVLGLEQTCGAIAPGLNADLVQLDDDLRVQRVMVGGRWIS